MIIKKVKKTIEEHTMISRGDHIVLGLSGGPDSVCLFDILKKLAPIYDLKIYPVHVNHKFRPELAERDQSYVEKICEDAGLKCSSFVVDCNELAKKEGLTSEEAGRKARYDAFYEVARNAGGIHDGSVARNAAELRAVKIAVAQNANDQAETILHRIIRGTGPDGLSGIPYMRKERGIPVIRPLLDVTRKEIEAYCAENSLAPVYDHTNEEPIYMRNRIRLELLPLLEEYNSNIIGSLTRLARIASDDRAYMTEAAKRALRDLSLCSGCSSMDEGTVAAADRRPIVLDRAGLAALPGSVRHRVVKLAFERIGLDQDITEERLQAADGIILKKQGPKSVEFPHHYILKVAKGQVSFLKQDYDLKR